MYMRSRRSRNFYTALGRCKFPFAAAVIYDSCAMTDTDRDGLLRMINLVSSYSLYRQADLQFLTVDSARNHLEDLQADFAITQLPTVIIFKEGSPVYDESGAIAMLSGSLSSDQLHTFIDTYLQDDLNDRVQQKNEERQRKAEEAAYYWNTAPWWYGGCWSSCYPGWGGCGYGGWGYGGCGYGGGVGFSCGFCL